MNNTTTPDVENESELKVIPLRELQVKLRASLRGDSSEFVIQVLTNVFQFGNYQIAHLKRVPIIDEYLDTNNFLLYRTKQMLRIRRKEAKLTVTTKEFKRFAVGEFHREERNWDIEEAVYEQQLAVGFERYRNQLKDLGTSSMSIKLKVINERDTYFMKGDKDEYELAVDVFAYTNLLTGQHSVQQFEIEVEAKNEAAVTRLPAIKKNLLFLLSMRADFRFAEDTKYERGVKLLGLLRPPWLQRASAWAMSPNASLINLSFTLIGIFFTVVFGILAIVVTIMLTK